MVSRRLEKAIRVIKESVSRTLLTRLNDPRIQGLVTVTEVEITPDMKNATVYLSVLGTDEAGGRMTFTAIRHAAGVIQADLGRAMTSRNVPHLRFEQDRKTVHTLETLRLIEQVSEEWKRREDSCCAEEQDPDKDRHADEEQ